MCDVRSCDNCFREFRIDETDHMWGFVCPHCGYNNARRRDPTLHYWQYTTIEQYCFDIGLVRRQPSARGRAS